MESLLPLNFERFRMGERCFVMMIKERSRNAEKIKEFILKIDVWLLIFYAEMHRYRLRLSSSTTALALPFGKHTDNMKKIKRG